MPKIYDNIEHRLTIGLNEALQPLNRALRADFCVGYFNLRGWKEVADTIENLPGATVQEGSGAARKAVHRVCRLLVGMQKMPVDILRESFWKDDDYMMDQAEAARLKQRLAQEFKDQLIIGTPTNADERALRQLSRQLKDNKLAVKLHVNYPLHAKLYLAYSGDTRIPVMGFLGSSNLTLSGLSKQGELNIDVLEQDAALKLSRWFDDRWNDRWCLDITKELIEVIDNSWATETPVPPYYVYLKIAYHLSQEARSGINEFDVPAIFKQGSTQLLPFQSEAVRIAAKKLHKRDGIMIGDVVGLGKTITACALAKLFEENFHYNTLIICPKNLRQMWEHYVLKYEMRAKVISLSMLSKDLPRLQKYNFRQVIIDESHNLRNHQGARYRLLKEFLEQNNGKVILLSATPYNKSYLDLSNQLRLFIADDSDLGISPDIYINSIGGEQVFGERHTETFIRSIKAFEKSEFPDDWRELMRLYLIRRTRSFIKNNYAETDPENGRKYLTFADGSRSYFPDRVPLRVLYEFNPADPDDIYANLYSERIVNSINNLHLPRYGLQQYLMKKPPVKPTANEVSIMNNLSHAGRRLMGFCRTNLFKRLESSGYSFLLSLGRHALRNYLFVYAIQNGLPLPIGKNISQNLDGFLEDSDTDDNGETGMKLILKEEDYLQKAGELYNLFSGEKYKHRFDWIRCELFTSHLLHDLRNDSREILRILEYGKNWQPEKDRQLNALHDLIERKHGSEKVLVFTQFADTARYLTEQLRLRGVQKIEHVTGDDENPTAKAHRFSPDSNEKTELKGEHELRVLIATDVLSEGQNLQDAHIILNYDLPWAIIRLIQRAGRVDRIGQKAEKILCYSFLPEDGIEQIINLRARLAHRIRENAEVVGSDETFFDGDPVNLADLYNEKAGMLDEEEENDSEVDLASLAYQIWKNATDANPELNSIIPNLPLVTYTAKAVPKPDTEIIPLNPRHSSSVIVYTRTPTNNDVLAWLDSNGNIITHSQYAILKAAECTPDEPPLAKSDKHHELVQKAVHLIRREEHHFTHALGKKSSEKYRTYMRLDKFCKERLFVPDELKKAVNDIFRYPLREFARETLNRRLKEGISDEQLAELVVSLREDEKLVIANKETTEEKAPQIICSLGLI